jgi:hypothetical protein
MKQSWKRITDIAVPAELKEEEDFGPIEENFTGNVNEYVEPEF